VNKYIVPGFCKFCKLKFLVDEKPGQDRTARKIQPGQYCQDRTDRTELPEQDNQPREDWLDRTVRM
jgi:hypothetical protein